MEIKETANKGLTVEEESSLLGYIEQFREWLVDRKVVISLPIVTVEDLPSSSADWVMKYDDRTKAVYFNTFSRKDGSFEYYTSTVLHEYFHLVVQRVPNKDDAKRIKDDFGGELMNLIDIEADFFTALFFKEKLGYELVQYLKLYYEGSKVFRDNWIRVTKLERYIGTLLGISKMFITHYKSDKQVETHDIYLLSIGPFFTEDNLHVLVIRKEHIYFDVVKASMADLISIKDCYTNIDEISLRAYVRKIVSFVTKALSLTLPTDLEKEISTL